MTLDLTVGGWRTIRTIAAVLLLCLAAFGCEQPPMRGIIIKKNHRGMWVQIVPISTGRSVLMTTIVHPEQWDVVIQADGTDGDTGQHLVVVRESYWNSVRVGDVWERADTINGVSR